MKYKKEIEVTSTGMVVARVIDDSEKVKGLAFFSQLFNTNKAVERSCKKAHEWADERVAICERQEV